ncbi:hypothetical protein Vretifemale_14795 [Volvox reticuliferus]|uniref:Rhodanese domain-containing protein n=1 Tax=Volvox reticuliferus TaxID=1737510 RepID=A0A8J4CQG0_9CHLO|nr:hypothetical protein Vretifemale_14795 [Volvox reticuliferus]
MRGYVVVKMSRLPQPHLLSTAACCRVEPLLQGVDPGTELYVICLSAHRSIGALKWLNERGFGNVKQLKGGMQAWRSQRLTEVKEDVAANQEAAPACSGCPGRQTSGEEGTCKPCCTAES